MFWQMKKFDLEFLVAHWSAKQEPRVTGEEKAMTGLSHQRRKLRMNTVIRDRLKKKPLTLDASNKNF